MPLRDHFRPPLDNKFSWDGLHAGWPMVMVQQLAKVLPSRYFALPGVYLGSLYEVDIGAFRDTTEAPDESEAQGNGAVAVYSPPKPTVSLEPKLPNQDVYEVRIYDGRRDRKLVAAIEIVSPSNKDRPERRTDFVAKVAGLLKNGICVSIVDIVTTIEVNLYAELMDFVQGIDPALGDHPPPTYAVTLQTRYEDRRKLMDNWYHPVAIGQSLPTLPIWLRENLAVSLELEATYEETCRTLRIA
jgi:hypothetical protein